MLPAFLQGILSTLLCLLALPVLLLRRKTRRGLSQRLGNLPSPSGTGPRVWVHAASAGDVKNVWPVVRALKEAHADTVVMLTYITNSAEDMVPTLAPPPDVHAYLPLDAPPFVGRALSRWRPSLLLLEMTELWPTLVAHAHTRGIPVALCNGRMSDRSARRYRTLFKIISNPIPLLSRLCLQTEADQARYVTLGAAPDRCRVTGNCKFDAAARTPPVEKVQVLRAVVQPLGPLLVAGSTHQGEEDVVLEALASARKASPTTRLLWAPRYLEHADSLVSRARTAGFSSEKRSGQACATADVVVLDTMGELAAAYALGTVALVGGSFVPRGGQNILEPAAQGVPVLHGPHMFLAPDQTAVLDGNGALQVTREQVGETLGAWLKQPDEAKRVGALGRERVAAVAGAAARHLEHLKPLLPR